MVPEARARRTAEAPGAVGTGRPALEVPFEVGKRVDRFFPCLGVLDGQSPHTSARAAGRWVLTRGKCPAALAPANS